MMDQVPEPPAVRLERWVESDLALLRRLNAPAMTEFLGGPEPEEKLVARHQRYVEFEGAGGMFRVVALPEDVAAGSVGYWEREWLGGTVYETGWSILPEFQGRGLAVAATRSPARAWPSADGRHRYLHAYPKVAHAASNAICRKAGFTLLGEVDFEYPKGVPIRCNDWRYDLHQS